MTDTAYHNERFGRGGEIAPDRVRARVEAKGGAVFFIGIELPCEPAQAFTLTNCCPFWKGAGLAGAGPLRGTARGSVGRLGLLGRSVSTSLGRAQFNPRFPENLENRRKCHRVNRDRNRDVPGLARWNQHGGPTLALIVYGRALGGGWIMELCFDAVLDN
jgi:hypothetical protein